MEAPPTLAEYFLEGCAAVLVAITAYFSKKTIDNIDTAEKEAAKNALDLANFKTHVADNYAKIHTLDRVHDRIDAVTVKVEDVASDVKLVLHKIGKL